MADNYPSGAANDPLAPYNQDPDWEQVEVLIKSSTAKETTVEIKSTVPEHLRKDHILTETMLTEVSAAYLIIALHKIVEELIACGKKTMSGYYLRDLYRQSTGWYFDGIEVTEK